MKTSRIAVLAAFAFAAPLARAADTAPAAKARNVELTLTDTGLAPAEVKLTKGEPVHLAITRKTDKTCMFDVVIPDAGVKQALPLNKTVYADFTPTKTGTLKVLCGMGMQYGKLVVN